LNNENKNKIYFPPNIQKINWPFIIHVHKCYTTTYLIEIFVKTLYRTFINNVHWATNPPLSQPHFWKSVRMTLTFLKWGLGNSPGLPKLQSSTVGVKTPRLETFLISLESYQSENVENGLAWTIWTSEAQVITKRRVGSQFDNLTPDH